jgi:integrase
MEILPRNHGTMHRKMSPLPNAGKDWAWFWSLPSYKLSIDYKIGIVRRHHVHKKSCRKSIKTAGIRAEIAKRITVHTLRHGFATPHA